MSSMPTLKSTAVAMLLTVAIEVAGAANGNLHRALLPLGGSSPASIRVVVKLSGDQEVPPVRTRASGNGVFNISSDGAITGEVTTHGMRGTMAHIHQAAPSQPNGPPIITLLGGPHDTWRVPQGSKLTPAQYKSFRAGYLYVNLYSAAHTSGLIRGQLRPPSSSSQMFLGS